MKKLLSVFTKRRIIVTFFLGISSGLPLALTGGTLQAWLNDYQLSLTAIGFIGMASLPYTLKFLWAPFMDRWVPPFLGRRRGWIFICQLMLCLAIASMALFSPDQQPQSLFIMACFIAFFSASQDIVIDAYRTDVLQPIERAFGGAMSQNGYRIAMLISGGAALVIADFFGWKVCYLLMSALMGICTVATFLGPEPENSVVPPRNIRDCIILPFIDFLKRPQAVWILLLIIFYKLGDAFAGSLSQTFLLREIHMSKTEVGTLAKTLGFFGTVFGTTAGGLMVFKMGWFRALLLFGILQAVSNLSYMPLMWIGPDYFIAGIAIFIENFCGGMGAAAFVGLLMNLCNARFSAFQYALLSSLSAVGRVFIGPIAGFISDSYGWTAYFIASLVFSIPGIVLLFLLRNSIENMLEIKDVELSE